MQSKKKDKKKFKRKNLKISNITINDIDDFYENEIVEEKKAARKLAHKIDLSSKSGLNLQKGRVIEIKSNYRCIAKINNKLINAVLGGRLKQSNKETRNILAVGDYVNIDLSDNSRIEEILPRKNVLARFTEDEFQYQLIIASNIDQVIITSSFHEPDINFGLIDRFICMSFLYGINPVICINKADLIDNIEEYQEILDFYKSNNIKVIVTSSVTGEGIVELKELLRNRDSVFSGHSGAGKSSLINALEPGLDLRVGDVSEYSNKGTHTTTSSRLIQWSFGGYLVDTPGIKTFGFKRDDRAMISRVFPGFSSYYKHCNFNDCSHIHEIKCAVKEAVDKDLIPLERYNSYLRIIESLEE